MTVAVLGELVELLLELLQATTASETISKQLKKAKPKRRTGVTALFLFFKGILPNYLSQTGRTKANLFKLDPLGN